MPSVITDNTVAPDLTCLRCLLIGCSDNPTSGDLGLVPSVTLFHDNMGNLVAAADLNFLSAIHYAVEICKVESIIICGHHGCRSISAGIEKPQSALVTSWLRPIVELANRYRNLLEGIPAERQRLNALCELNVIEQTAAVCRIPVVEIVRQTSDGLSVRGIVLDGTDLPVAECDFLIRPGESIRARTDEAILEFRRRWRL